MTEQTAPDQPVGGPNEPAKSQFALLKTRRFLPLFVVQFLGAFNDQVFQKAFIALITYRLADQVGLSIPLLGLLASALFILPFAIVTPTAGQIADRIDKARMIRWVKAWEIVVMGMAVIGYYTQSIGFLYLVLFLMGAQSAMFAPVKYSILPQYLDRSELLGGNALVQGATFLAIIFGTILGNELILTERGVLLVSVTVVAVAVVGFIASLYTPPAPAQGGAPKVDWFFPRAIWHLVARCRANWPAFRVILAISWFWFLGATFLALLSSLVRETFGANYSVLTILLAAFSIGIACGAVASSVLSKGRISANLAPVGALGLAIVAVELWFAASAAIPTGELAARVIACRETPMNQLVTPCLTVSEFFSTFGAWRVLIDFILVAIFAGIYVTPLNAILQVEAPDAERARYIACSNVLDASGMVVSAGLGAVLVMVGLTTADILALFTLTGLPVCLIVARWAPDTALGRIALSIWPQR